MARNHDGGSRACIRPTPTGIVALSAPPWPEDTALVIEKPSLSRPPAGYRFPRQVIAVAVRWYLRYGLSYRDVEELLAEGGVTVHPVMIYRWVQTFTPEFIDAARPARRVPRDRWYVDEVRHEALWLRVR